MSNHELKVFRISEVTPWPQSDQLDGIFVGGWLCAVRRGEFKAGELAVFVEPDFVVPTTEPEFAFLALDRAGKPRENPPTHYRITARKLRGTWSQGLIMHAREGWVEGQDVRELLGVVRWEAPEPKPKGPPNRQFVTRKVNSPPPGLGTVPYYDIEAGRKFSKHWTEFCDQFHLDLVVTEKIHGANMAVVFKDGQLYVRSRTVWKAKPQERFWPRFWRGLQNVGRKLINMPAIERPRITSCWWWGAVDQNPWIEQFARMHEGLVIFGEVFGPNVQGPEFSYGLKNGEFGFRAFDVYDPALQSFWPFEKVVKEMWSGNRFVPYRRVCFGPGPLQPVNPTGPSEVGGGIFREGLVYRSWSKDARAEAGSGLPLGERLVFKDVCPQWLAAQKAEQ